MNLSVKTEGTEPLAENESDLNVARWQSGQ